MSSHQTEKTMQTFYTAKYKVVFNVLNAHLQKAKLSQTQWLIPFTLVPQMTQAGELFKPTSSCQSAQHSGTLSKKKKPGPPSGQSLEETYFNKTICGHLEVDTRHIVWRYTELTD